MSNAESFWKHYAASKRYATHCSTDVLFHAGALKITYGLGVMRAIERDRQDLARRIAMGETVTVTMDGKTMTINQGAGPETHKRDAEYRQQMESTHG